MRIRWGPDRRRWGPHQDDHFRRLISLLDQIWKGSNFGAGSQRTHPVNNRGLTCATPLALANNYTKESPQATKVSEGLARLDADRAEIATQSSGSRREWTRRSRGRIRTAGPFRGNGLVSSAEQEVPESGAILGGPRVRFPVPPAGSMPLGGEAARGAGLFSVPRAVHRPQSGASAATLKTLYRFGVHSGGGTTFDLTPNCNEWHQALPAGDEGRLGIRHKQIRAGPALRPVPHPLLAGGEGQGRGIRRSTRP